MQSPKLQRLNLTTHVGDLIVNGATAASFWQGQLTCDVNSVTATHSSLAARCNLKGRVVGLGRLYYAEQQHRLTLPQDLLALTEQSLKLYAQLSRVTLRQDCPPRLGVLGSEAEAWLIAQGITPPAEPNDCVTTASGMIIRHLGSTPRFEWVNPPVALLSEAEAPFSAWQAAQIEAGEPWLSADTSSEFLPHELNLPPLQAVSFQKGCYLGQEIIARMEYRGHLKNHLARVTLPTTGRIVCAVDGQALAIIVTPRLDRGVHG